MRMVPAISAAVLAATALTATPVTAAPAQPDPVKAPGRPDKVPGPPDKDDFSLSEARKFCSTHVLSVDQMKRGEISKVRCYPTKARAKNAVGIAPTEEDLAAEVELQGSTLDATVEGSATRAAGTIWAWAEHYDFHGFGSYLLITGGDQCDGSGLAISAGDPWNDRISSTRPLYCGKVKHWQHWDHTGAVQNTQGGGTLFGLNGDLNNQTSSTAYYTG